MLTDHMDGTESARAYEYLLTGFGSRFDWLGIVEQNIDPSAAGLPTVLMEEYICQRFLERYNKEPELKGEWQRFFEYIEELMQSEDTSLTDIIDTTLLESLASEVYADLESILPYCGKKTRQSIYNSIRLFYGKPQRAEQLHERFP